MISEMDSSTKEALSALLERAQTLEKLGNLSEAEKVYDQIINSSETVNRGNPELNHIFALACNNRGHIKYLQVNFQEAVKDYNCGLQFRPLAVTYYNRGLIHYRMGYFTVAVSDQKAALELDPSFTSAQQCLEQAKLDMEHKGHKT